MKQTPIVKIQGKVNEIANKSDSSEDNKNEEEGMDSEERENARILKEMMEQAKVRAKMF